MKDSVGWQRVYSTVQTDSVIKQVALNMKFGAQNTDKMLSFALSNNTLHLWKLGDEGQLQKRGLKLLTCFEHSSDRELQPWSPNRQSFLHWKPDGSFE